MAAKAHRGGKAPHEVRRAIDHGRGDHRQADVGREIRRRDPDAGGLELVEEPAAAGVVYRAEVEPASARSDSSRSAQSAMASRSTTSQSAWLIASSR